MKKLFLIIQGYTGYNFQALFKFAVICGKQFYLSIFLILPFVSRAQTEFAPVGTQWYYDAGSGFYTGFEKIQSEKDTSIDGLSCRKLSRTWTFYDGLNHQTETEFLPPLFVRDSNAVYYFYQNNHFSILYDFNKQPGESWTTDAFDFSDACGPIGQVYVDSAGIQDIDGSNLKWIVVHNDGTYAPYFGDKKRIYERIGSLQYLFPVPGCVIWEGYYVFRCYFDSAIQYSTAACDSFYNYIAEPIISNEISLYPDPVQSELNINLSLPVDNITIRVFDLQGRMIALPTTFINTQVQLNTKNLPNGFYTLQIISNSQSPSGKNGTIRIGKFVKQE